MTDIQFVKLCKETIATYVNDRLDKTDNTFISPDDVYIVWQCKALQNWKALASTTLSDGMYYEIAYSSCLDETYVDVYKKCENFIVEGGE